jgi:hypothetical protein
LRGSLMAEQWPLEPMVEGSSPSPSVKFKPN